MVIATAGLRCVYGVATGALPCVVVDTGGKECETSVSVTVVPDMGKHLFSPMYSRKRGVHTIFATENRELHRRNPFQSWVPAL